MQAFDLNHHHQSDAHTMYMPQPSLSRAAHAASDHLQIHVQMIAPYKGKPSCNTDTQCKCAYLQVQFHPHAETTHLSGKHQHMVDVRNVGTTLAAKLCAQIEDHEQ